MPLLGEDDLVACDYMVTKVTKVVTKVTVE